MLKTKYEYNFYSFYDHTGMEQHFEKMAAQGEARSRAWKIPADALTSCVTDAGALGAGDGLCRCFVQ